MILFGVVLSLLLNYMCGDSRLDLGNCEYGDNTCIGIKYSERLEYSLSVNELEGCLKMTDCDIILRGRVESNGEIKWIFRIATKTLYRNVMKDIHIQVYFGVLYEKDDYCYHIEFYGARSQWSTNSPSIGSQYNPIGVSLVQGLSGGSVLADETQSVFHMEKYWPKNITEETKYFYIHFWSPSTISYSVRNTNISHFVRTTNDTCSTNLITDDYYVNLYALRYVPYGGYTASFFNRTIIDKKINLFRHGLFRQKSIDEDNSKLLLILLISVIICASAIAILLIVCCVNGKKDPVSLETQQRNQNVTTFKSLDTQDTKKSHLCNEESST